MKQISLLMVSAFLLALGVTANDSKDAEAVLEIETDKSKVVWNGKKVTGEHTGDIMLDNGKVYVQGENVTRANVKMNMNSITCNDLTDPQWNKKLVDHLKSDDFFSVEKFPVSTFIAKSFSQNPGMDNEGNNYVVKGDLTIKGITHEISFPAKIKIDEGQLIAHGSATLDRTKWDVKYGSGSFFKGLGDNLIYDDFEIKFELVANAETVN